MNIPLKFNKNAFYALSLVVLVVVACLAALSLRNAFSGDQALFLIYSKAINGGAIYYKDVWDIKQPAIIFFYLLGGKLFGFTEIGIHLLEMIYWLGFCILLIFGLRKHFSSPIFAVLTPMFTVGIYYSVSSSLHITQVEGLVAFPLFLSIWFCQKFLRNPDKVSNLFLSGFFGGIVLTFKLMFVVLLFGFWLACFVYLFYNFKKDLKQILILGGLIFAGMVIPMTIFVVYFAVNNALGDLWYATFVYPANAVATITMNERSYQLETGLIWFFKSYFPVISLSLILLLVYFGSLFGGWRERVKFASRSENYLIAALFVWLFLGFAVIMIQKLSWWEYHYSLLMIPLGILAVKSIENLLGLIMLARKPLGRVFGYACLIALIGVIFVPTTRRLAQKIREFNQPEIIKIGDREALITGAALSDYRSISADVEFLTKENPKPPVFIVSNPLYYYLADYAPVFASNGAMSDMFTDVEWERLNREMADNPPKFVFIETRLIEPTAEKNPVFIDALNSDYSIHSTGERGSFYKRKQ